MVERTIKYFGKDVTLKVKNGSVYYENTYKFKALVKNNIFTIFRFSEENNEFEEIQSYDIEKEIEELMKSSIYKAILVLLNKI